MDQFNQQQQPAWISASTNEMADRTRALFRSVYGWMFGGLLLTAVASLWVVNSPSMQQLIFANRMVPWILMIAEFGLVIYLSAGMRRMSPAAAASAFLVFALLNGLTLSAIFFVYTASSIVQAFVASAGMFGAMSVYGMVTKRDLTSWGAFFFMGLIGIVICSLINMFVRSSGFSLVISIVGVFVFVGLTAWDTQKIKVMATSIGPEAHEKIAIYGALSLYLDFINLFLMLLRIFGDRRR